MAMILCLEATRDDVFQPRARIGQQKDKRGVIEHHSISIASICFSPGIEDGILVVAVNPLFYGASRCSLFRRQHLLTLCSCEAHCVLAPEEEDMGASGKYRGSIGISCEGQSRAAEAGNDGRDEYSIAGVQRTVKWCRDRTRFVMAECTPLRLGMIK
jgi:hypothetical protein